MALAADMNALSDQSHDLRGRVDRVRDLAVRVNAVAKDISHAGVDSYAVVACATRTRGSAERLSRLGADLDALLDWLRHVDRFGVRSGAMPAAASLGMASVPKGAQAHDFESRYVEAFGHKFTAPSRPGGRWGALKPSADGPNHPAIYGDPSTDVSKWLAKGKYGPGQYSSYQCTAWVNFRWAELGYRGPYLSGNGGAVARNRGKVADEPTLAAVASYQSGYYGHVMFVEKVTLDLEGEPVSFVVSEGNAADSSVEGHASEWGTSRAFERVPGKPVRWREAGKPGSTARAIDFAVFPEG